MKAILAALMALVIVCWPRSLEAERIDWRLGGPDGVGWEAMTFHNVLADVASVDGAIQPVELDPAVNFVTQQTWTRYRFPIVLDYLPGNPRVWRGIGERSWPGASTNALEFVDGDLETHFSIKDWTGSGGLHGSWGEFYTVDFGAPIPAERFVLVPAEGVDPFSQEPYRPNYTLRSFDLTGTNDVAKVNLQEVQGGGPLYYQPLDFLLKSIAQNFDSVPSLEFPLQYVQFLRIRLFPDQGTVFSRFSVAEFEVYGRGFVPSARWVSQVVDLGQTVNIGQVHFGLSKWRRNEEGSLVPAPESAARVRVEVKTGLDDTPIAYQSYNDLQQLVEVTRAEYERLKPRVFTWDPPSVGWRGPVIEDQDRWSFWAPPLRQSGQVPRVPSGRYLQLQINLETDALWTFARLDSLRIEASPILAQQVLGEVAVVGDLLPERQLAEVEAGERTEFVCDIGAHFSGSGQSGFDAVRFLTPSASAFVELQMGDPLARVGPDSLVQEAAGFVVFLPQAVTQGAPGRLRVQLETTVFGVSGQLGVEVFERDSDSLPQSVESGDVSAEIGTDQLRVVAQGAWVGSILGQVDMQPAAFTPQGDGINDRLRIGFTLFRVRDDAQVDIEVFAVDGRPVRNLAVGALQSGRHSLSWNGRDGQGRRVPPGLYLVQVKVVTDKGTTRQVQPVAVAY